MHRSVALSPFTVLHLSSPSSPELSIFQTEAVSPWTTDSPSPSQPLSPPSTLCLCGCVLFRDAIYVGSHRTCPSVSGLCHWASRPQGPCTLLQNVLPFQGCITVHCVHGPQSAHPSIHPWTLGSSTSWLPWITLRWAQIHKCLFQGPLTIPWSPHAEAELLVSTTIVSEFLRNGHSVFHGSTVSSEITSLPPRASVSVVPRTLAHRWPLVSEVLFAACELGVFDLLSEALEPLGSAAVAVRLGTSSHGTQLLLDTCVSLKLLQVETSRGKGKPAWHFNRYVAQFSREEPENKYFQPCRTCWSSFGLKEALCKWVGVPGFQ